MHRKKIETIDRELDARRRELRMLLSGASGDSMDSGGGGQKYPKHKEQDMIRLKKVRNDSSSVNDFARELIESWLKRRGERYHNPDSQPWNRKMFEDIQIQIRQCKSLEDIRLVVARSYGPPYHLNEDFMDETVKEVAEAIQRIYLQ